MICVAVIQEAICQMASEGVFAKEQEGFSMVPQNYGGRMVLFLLFLIMDAQGAKWLIRNHLSLCI